MKILVSGEPPCDLAPVRRAIHAAVRPYRLPTGARVGLAFVDDVVMRELNGRHRGKPRTTDVLSFGQALPPGAKGVAAARALARDVDGELDVGDIVISAGQAARQAKRRRQPLVREVAFLAAHKIAQSAQDAEDDVPMILDRAEKAIFEIAERRIRQGFVSIREIVKESYRTIDQLSRAPEARTDRRPMLSDLRESGSIEQDADVVMFIYREDVYDQNSERKGIADILVSKHRNGPIGRKELFFHDRFAKFESLDNREVV